MNEKTARQIAEMKNQTIGVEVEMNSITRQKAAKVHLERMGQSRARVEIPEGRFHCGAGRTGMRTGHPDLDLR